MYLNEKSWHVQQEDLYVIDEKIRKFLDIYALMKRKNPRKEIFVSEDEQLYIDSKNYPLAKWLSEADIEYRRLYLSFWSKRITYKPEDEYEVNVEDEILKGGTEAYLNDSFMVSIGLDEKWEQKDIKATLFSVYEEEQEIKINMQHDLASMIKEKKLFLLDIDGTVALGSELLPGAADFLYTVKENGGIFRFLTNNSSKAARDYVEQFHDWGIETTEEEFITAGTYARDFLKKYYENEKILVAATETYCNELRKAGLNITDQAEDDVDCVLCAYDTELTYEKLVQVCKQLTETKVPWFATNPDLRCPIDFGMVPDCGSICRMITASVGREPEYIGKPAPGMVYACLEETGCTPKQTLLIGDRIYTDMECGKRAGVDSCLVLTGEASAEEWKNGFRCQSLGKLVGYFS